MNCENYLKLIDELIEGALDEKRADEVSLHIFACPNCTTQFEMLEREKEIYSHYLFEVEPPINLQRKFEAKLFAPKKAGISSAHNGFWTEIFAFLRFNPALLTAIVLIVFAVGFVLTNLQTKEQPIEKAETVEPPKSSQFTADEKIIVSTTPEKIENSALPKNDKLLVKKVEKIKPEMIAQPIAVKRTEAFKKVVPKVKTVSPMPKVDSEEMARFKQLQALEAETTKQLEKVELLLRAFRNAEMVGDSETYDVAYESQQARRLLQTNVTLRQKVETYGTFYTGEMLSRVEPYLLDIANLDAKPSPEQVLEIKDRVRNQNIIASLQVY